MELGKKIWVFADGDLPPQGQEEPLGHEALIVVNNGEADARLKLDILFPDQEPHTGVLLEVPARRVRCFRLDYPIGEDNYQIPAGQYALVMNSSVPVVAVFGRLDRRENVAYYCLSGHAQ